MILQVTLSREIILWVVPYRRVHTKLLHFLSFLITMLRFFTTFSYPVSFFFLLTLCLYLYILFPCFLFYNCLYFSYFTFSLIFAFVYTLFFIHLLFLFPLAFACLLYFLLLTSFSFYCLYFFTFVNSSVYISCSSYWPSFQRFWCLCMETDRKYFAHDKKSTCDIKCTIFSLQVYVYYIWYHTISGLCATSRYLSLTTICTDQLFGLYWYI